jgi:hypothetical protein
MRKYYMRVITALWKDFSASTREQVIGALLVIAILICQIRYGLIKPGDISANLWAIFWPYTLLVGSFFLYHLVRAPKKLDDEHEKDKQSSRDEGVRTGERVRQLESVKPEMEVQISTIITKGALNQGVTDLFVHVILTLKAPAEVLIRDFSITAMQGTEYMNAIASDDVVEWEVMKENPAGGYFHIPCVPVPKNLRQRGDPVEGWIHFPLSNLSESWLLKTMLWIKVNSAYGTCLKEAQGSRAFPDPTAKGVMRKRSEFYSASL